ncbi:MAG: ketopantoate reductase family protein, partial [Balneolaceae bacterium]|nr:ketopantoate reductase family protein [Balneolaceae bacterium]
AVGGYFGGRIAERTSRSVTLIARGEHLQAIRDRGLEIKSPEGDSIINSPAYDDPANAPPQDLILFTVKSYDTDKAIEQVRPAVSERTQVLTIQNGIENYEKLRRAFGEDRVIRGLCRIGANMTRPGTIAHNSLGSIVVGEPDGSTTERLEALAEVFEETRIRFSISDEILREVWVKFAWNSIFNMVTAVAAVTVDKLFEDQESERLCRDLFDEIQEVAAAEGVSLTDQDKESIIDKSGRLEGFTTSTYADRKKGKQLEFEAFTGAIVRLARQHGIRVPHNETLYALLKLID